MEARFKSLSIFEFQELFPDQKSCYAHLAKLKWAQGFNCVKCGHGNYCKAIKEFDRQCTSCRHTESPTAGTLFHRLKFPILKAFWIIYFLSTNKKGMSSTELSRKLELRQKTCWLFKQKVMKGMQSSGQHPLTGDVEVDEFLVGQQEAGKSGRAKGNKRLVVLAIERHGAKGASRMYAKKIEKASAAELVPFVKEKVDLKANLKTDAWAGYGPLAKEYANFTQVLSGPKGNNFNTLHRVIMGFKAWLRATHSHVKHLQPYLDEYAYRYNRSFMKENIFDNLLNRMIQAPPHTYKMIIN